MSNEKIKDQHLSDKQPKHNHAEYDEYELQTTTLWDFPERGSWSTHNGDYRGNWSPHIPRNIILRYSEEGDIVLDQFLGSGTTLIETALLNRRGMGVDINPIAIDISIKRIRHSTVQTNTVIKKGDACNIYFIKNDSVDLICTHPPYANIVHYSKNIDGDLSNLDIDKFLEKMQFVAAESFRVLKQNKYCAILMGDTRRKKHIIPLGFYVMQVFLSSGFILKEIIIKKQHNCTSTSLWYKRSIDQNFLLLAHEYLFVFRKP